MAFVVHQDISVVSILDLQKVRNDRVSSQRFHESISRSVELGRRGFTEGLMEVGGKRMGECEV